MHVDRRATTTHLRSTRQSNGGGGGINKFVTHLLKLIEIRVHLGCKILSPHSLESAVVSNDFNGGVDAGMQQLRPIKNEINSDPFTHEWISCILPSLRQT